MDAAARLVRDVRAFAGTLWLNLVLARAVTQPSTLIHANDLDTLLAGVLLRRRFGAKLVYDSHELYPEMLAGVSPLYAGLWRLLEHHLIRRADAVITVNDSIADELERRHGLMRRPSVVMNCPPRDEATDLSTGGENGNIRLLYHGGFQRDRGLEELVGAIAHVDPGATLDLRGSGPLRDDLRQLAVQHGVERRIRFLDPVPPDRLVAAMAGCSIGVVPYLPTSLNNYLCTPNKLFEYMMGGLAVVASDLPELRRIVCTHGVGIVYRATDARALAAAINGLLRDSEGLARCRAAARRAALEHYNWQAQAAILRDAYLDLLGSS